MLSPGPNFWTETYRDRPFEAASWALQRKSMIQMELFGPRYDSVMNTRNYDVETKKLLGGWPTPLKNIWVRQLGL